MDWERVYRDLKKLNWVILLILGAASYYLAAPSFTRGIILGGLIIIANFHLFQRTFRTAFSPKGFMQTTKFSIVARFYLRLMALGVILYILINQGWADPVGLVIGLSTVVISIVSFGVKGLFKHYYQEATD